MGLKGIYRFDAQGNQLGSTPLPEAALRTLAGLWQGKAVLVGKKGVALLDLASPAKAR